MVRSKPTVPDMNTQTPVDPSADPDEIERLEAEAVNAAWKRKPLYEARKKIFPKRAEGTYRRFKWLIMLVTLGIYYITPWLRWDAGRSHPTRRYCSTWPTGGSTSSSSRSGRRSSSSSRACW
jgi:hypothetical protein